MMTKQSLAVGHTDTIKSVEFLGQRLSHTRDDQTELALYETHDGRLLVHEHRTYEDGGSRYTLWYATPDTLGPGGLWESLGRTAGFGIPSHPPLDLEEAVTGLVDAIQAAA